MPLLSDFAENELLDALVGNGTYNNAAPHLSLHDGHPAETGANEVAGGSYARQPTVFDAAASGVTQNTAQEDFASMPAVTVFFAGLWDALAAGNFMAAIPLGAGARHLCTVNSTTDIFTSDAHGFVDDDRVVFTTGQIGDLPTGLSVTTIYHIITATTDTFQVSTTQGGAALNMTGDGEIVAFKVEPRVVNLNDTVSFPIGNVTLELD